MLWLPGGRDRSPEIRCGVRWALTPQALVALTRYSAVALEVDGTRRSRSAPPRRQVRYLLLLHTSALAPRLCGLLRDPQNADCHAARLPPLSGGHPATRAQQRNHFLL